MSHLKRIQQHLPDIVFRQASQFNDLDSGFHPHNLRAGLMAMPSSTRQVSDLLDQCNTLGLSVVTQGGRTGLSGAASTSAEQIILQTSKLNNIIQIDAVSGTALVESGVTLSALEDAANQVGLSCGIDLAARGSATLGGMVSTNAGGIEAFRNGVMRHRVLGLEVVLADGRIISDLKRVTKANEGYDIKQLFIGAEGTLGVVTKVVLSLNPLVTQTTTAIVSCQTADKAVTVFRQLRNHVATNLLSCEIMWPDYAHTVASAFGDNNALNFESAKDALFVIIESDSSNHNDNNVLEEALADLMDNGLIANAAIASNERQRNDIWRIREDSFIIDSALPHGLWFDMSVPLDELPRYVDDLFARITSISPQLRVFLIGHLGDGNLHATITTGAPIDALAKSISHAVYAGLHDIGGSFSAEHGIGIDKRDALQQYTPDTNLALMHEIKALFDPNNIMNPGKVL